MSTTDDTGQDTESAVAAAVTELDNSPVTDAVKLLTEEVQRLRAETKTLQHRVDDLEAERDDQATTIDALEVENRQLRERVTDLEQELADRPHIEWAGPNPKDLAITATEAGNTVKPYRAIRDRIDTDTYERLEDRVQRLEDGEAAVVVRGEFDGDELPIERKIAERKAGGDLSANKARATLIFPKFGGHAETRGGSQLVLSSGDVRAILRETTDRSEWPNETVKRAMTWTAKLTSHRNEKREWDARDDENLLTLRQGRSGELELVADIEEYRAYYAELAEAQE